MRLLAWDPNPISLGFCLCELKVLILTVLKFKIKKLKKKILTDGLFKMVDQKNK